VFEKDLPRYWLPYPWLSDSFPFVTFRSRSGQLPPNWSLNLLVRAEAGQRYTPRFYAGGEDYRRGDYNSGIGPSQSSINLRFSKYWKLGHRQKLTLFFEGRNLLNHKNYRRVNPFTGEGYRIGDYNPTWSYKWRQDGIPLSTDTYAYATGVVNPSYIINPRVLLWGVSYSW
jgi:hypothetical protein